MKWYKCSYSNIIYSTQEHHSHFLQKIQFKCRCRFNPVGGIWDSECIALRFMWVFRNTEVCGLCFYCSFPFQALTSVVNYREPKSICKAPELVCNHYLFPNVRSRWLNKLCISLMNTHSQNTDTPFPPCRCTAGQVLWQSVEEICKRNDREWSRGQTDQLHHGLQIHWWQRCVSEGEAMN